jgi:hypothetical protein
MKTLTTCFIATAALVSVAHADTKAPMLVKTAALEAPKPRSLEASEVQGFMKDLNAEIGRCYLDVAGDIKGAGHLELKLAIHRTGALDSVDIATPGLPAKLAKKVDSCVRALVTDMKFPARRTSTVAIVPFFYQHTAAPGSGPQYSCWNPKGCKTS